MSETRAINPETGEVLTVHPVASLFPMMSDDELDDLAADIKANGLVHPIVLDAEGVLIDGRNRLEACNRAGVAPTFTSLNGHEPVAFILSNNISRRHLSKGQAAMAVARARDFQKLKIVDAAASAGVSVGRVGQASTVLRHAPELADLVLAGARSLDDAYEEAKRRKQETEDAQAQADRQRGELERLRTAAPDLADLVTEERMTLPEALAALRERQERERQYRELTLRQLDQALAFLDPRQMTPEELAAQVCQHLDSSIAAERVARCAAVLTHLGQLLSTKED